MATARIGCSGWSYKGWVGKVYPEKAPSRTWFGHYVEHLDTVELNNTFYRLPTPEKVDGWREQAPPGFLYAAKVGQFCTHRKKLKDPDIWLPRHLDRVRRLGPHLGPNLLQLPPSWGRDVPRLEAVLEILPGDIRWSVELRDPSWLHDDVFDALARHGVALCLHDLLADHPRIRTTDWTYVRYHGPDALQAPYFGPYGEDRLARDAEWLGSWLDDGVDVYAYFNNDVLADAFFEARLLRGQLARWAPATATT
jgi:uncharacterized protein YecE (DUF72 family)